MAPDTMMPREACRPGHVEVPSTTNPLGVKGTGEAGTTAAPPALMNAILDALPPAAGAHLTMPATAGKIWHALRAASAA